MYSSPGSSAGNFSHLHINNRCTGRPEEPESEQGERKHLVQLQGIELGTVTSVSLCDMKALQEKEIMKKLLKSKFLTNSSGENFRFHYRKSTLFNVENVKI